MIGTAADDGSQRTGQWVTRVSGKIFKYMALGKKKKKQE